MVSSLLHCREKVGMTLLGVGIFYFLALAGTFAVVWLNAAHKTEAAVRGSATNRLRRCLNAMKSKSCWRGPARTLRNRKLGQLMHDIRL